MHNCAGIIAEYNPFHNGHRYQLEETRRLTGCRFVAVVMSGSFVQRGEVAMFDKYSRAKWALQNGADLVLQLPTTHACATAERFAQGAVRILGGTGIVDVLCFGSESGDVTAVKHMAQLSSEETEQHKQTLVTHLKQGVSFPSARARALAEHHGGQFREALSQPNDILGIEYIKAIDRYAPQITPYAVKRIGAAHDAALSFGSIASASALRRSVLENDSGALSACLPESVSIDVFRLLSEGGAPYAQSRLSDAILYALRRMSREELSSLPDVSEGLENVLYRGAREAESYNELLLRIKTKRYTLARLRRILIYALLGVQEEIYEDALPYIRVLGVKQSALSLLGVLSEKATLPVVTRFSDAASLPRGAKRLHDIDLLAAEVAPLALPLKKAAAFDYSTKLIIV